MPTIDPQIAGVEDDGTEAGQVRVKLSSSGLALRPLLEGYYTASKNGTATSEPRAEGDIFSCGYPVHFAQTVAGVANSVQLVGNFYGKRFGIAYVFNLTVAADFDVMIDKAVYPVTGSMSRLIDGTTAGSIRVAFVELADNLADGWHEWEVNLHGTDATSPVWMIVGTLEESRLGYVTPPQLIRSLEPVSLSTTPAVFPRNNGGAGAGGGFRTFQRVDYYNPDTVDRLVTISRNSVTIAQLLLKPAGTEGCYQSYPKYPGPLIAYNSASNTGSIGGGYTYKHAAAAGTAGGVNVLATLTGGY